MRYLAATFVVIWLASDLFAQQAPQPPIKLPPPPADAVQHLINDLRDARELAKKIPDNKSRQQLERLLDRIELRARRLGEAVPTASMPRTPMNKPDYDKLLASLRKESFDDGKLTQLNFAVQHNFFTSGQAKEIVKLFAFSEGQKKAALLLHPLLTDPANFATVVSVITFDSDRQEVLKAVTKP